ncbi:hypothetical protein FACS1894166_10120 [Bacilli bacterium]|nr:hypothetical protein FACS1894166_10120 [Bacilli bacterium]
MNNAAPLALVFPKVPFNSTLTGPLASDFSRELPSFFHNTLASFKSAYNSALKFDAINSMA